MKKEKKNILIVGIIVVILIVIVIGALVFFKDKTPISDPSGNQKVIASLESNSQSEVDTFIKNDLEENGYSLKEAKVYINPYGNSPLSAIMIFRTDKATTVTVTVKGKHDDDLSFEFENATDHYIPIYALYENYENVVEVTLGSGEKTEVKIPTIELENALDTTVNVNNVSQNDDGLYFITTPLNMQSFAIDSYGEIRWYADAMYFHNIVELDNGHLLIGTAATNGDGLSTQILEIDYLGRVYKTYEIDSGYVNDFTVKDDGNILLASKNSERETYTEYIIEVDRETGKVVKTWDLFEQLRDIDPIYTDDITRSDYFYNSGIEYYPDSDSLLLTYWGGEFVANMSYKDESLKWIFADPDNFTEYFDDVLLKGEGFTYPKAMHSAKLDGDTLTVFDNGYSTNNGDGSSAGLSGSYSSANTYKISGNSISLESTIDENKGLFSYALGDYDKVDGDDVILFGRELKNFNFNSGLNLNDYDNVVSRLIVKHNEETTLDIELDWGTYSVLKISMKGIDFSFDPIKNCTTLDPSPKEDITSEIVQLVGKAQESVPYEFGYSSGVIEHNVLFMSSDEAKLVLIDDNKNGAIYELKLKGESESKKIITDLAKGKYYVYVYENDVMYKTDKHIEIS